MIKMFNGRKQIRMAECLKRSFDCVDGGRLPKFPRIGVANIRLETESEISECDSESEHSFQMRDTASARDTSDTSSKSESEYTLASLSEGEVSEISSGPDDVCIVGDFDQLVSDFGSDISVVADLSDFSDRSTDPEISKADYWKCVRCGTTNKNPCFRLCIRCFRERKSGLPPRPKSRKNTLSQESISSSSTLEQQDSGLGLSQQSSPPDVSDASEAAGEPKCGCCFERPVDSIFLHGDVAHQIYCYKCSQRVWKERKRCPCCNRVSKVIKVYRSPMIGEN